MTNRKKAALAGALVLIMALSAVGGTVAWLNQTAELTNAFLVGAFTKPDDPPEKPNPDPDKPDPGDPDPDPDQKGEPATFIYEPYWNANGSAGYDGADEHRLLAGQTTVKDPYIGIGKKSENGYVLAYIENPMGEHVYFSLCKGWVPVDVGDLTKKVAITDENGSPTKTTGSEDAVDYYSSGLFAWVGTTGSGESEATSNTEEELGYPKLAALAPVPPAADGTGGKDAWTSHPVFTKVYTAKNGLDAIKAMTSDEQKMVVHAYIHQTVGTDDAGTAGQSASSKTVIDAAKGWANGIRNPLAAP